MFLIATNIVLSAQVKRECFKPFSSKDFSCHKTFASYLALTVLHKNTAKITREPKQRGKSKIVIKIASPARANNNCWLLLLEDNSEAGTEHCCALSKHVWQYASVVTLFCHLCYHPCGFSFLPLLSIAQTVSFMGQEWLYTRAASASMTPRLMLAVPPLPSLSAVTQMHKIWSLWMLLPVYYSISQTLAVLSIGCIDFQAQDTHPNWYLHQVCDQNIPCHYWLPRKDATCCCKHQLMHLQNSSVGQKSRCIWKNRVWASKHYHSISHYGAFLQPAISAWRCCMAYKRLCI